MLKDTSLAGLSRRAFLSRGGKFGLAAVAAGAGALGTEKALEHVGETQNGDAHPDPKHEVVIPTTCALCGPRGEGCGINAIVRDGKLIRVEGRKESHVNKGLLCAKAHASAQWLYSPQRLKHALRRVGPRGSGKFEKISWDKALDHIVEKLKEQKEKYGPESLAILEPGARTYNRYMSRFLNAHGSPNLAHSGICAVQKAFAYTYTLGGSPQPDIPNTNLYVIWGKQPIYSSVCKGGSTALLAAKARGAKIACVKPTMEPDVTKADIWIPIRPGTDAAFALALIHVIIQEKLYDAQFIHEWTYGFEQLSEHVKKHSPEWAEPITGLPAKQIRDFARLYATTKPACIEVGNGVEHSTSCNDTVRAISILSAITGNLGRKGGDLLSVRGQQQHGVEPFSLSNRITEATIDKIITPEFPRPFLPFSDGPTTAIFRVFESVLTEKPYPIRSIIAPGVMATVSNRGTARVLEALKKVDFFVVLDVMRTPEIDYADIVVPVATMYEIDHPFDGSGPTLEAHRRVIKPLGDYKSDYEFWLELGTRMGYGKDFWNGDIYACMDEQLRPQGITYAELRQGKRPRPHQPEGVAQHGPASEQAGKEHHGDGSQHGSRPEEAGIEHHGHGGPHGPGSEVAGREHHGDGSQHGPRPEEAGGEHHGHGGPHGPDSEVAGAEHHGHGGAEAHGGAGQQEAHHGAPPAGAAFAFHEGHKPHDEANQHGKPSSPGGSGPGGGPGPGGGHTPQYENYAEAFATRSARLDRGPFLPEGKVAIYNTTFEKHGYSPLPEWREPPESPTATPHLLAQYPLTLSDFHTSDVYTAGWQRNLPYLREVKPEPTLQIHPRTAADRHIAHGDKVIVESPHGSITLTADVNPGIRPDTVMALHGWWQGCSELKQKDLPLLVGGANVNSMYSTDPAKAYDPLVTAMTSQTLVQVRKA